MCVRFDKDQKAVTKTEDLEVKVANGLEKVKELEETVKRQAKDLRNDVA